MSAVSDDLDTLQVNPVEEDPMQLKAKNKLSTATYDAIENGTERREGLHRKERALAENYVFVNVDSGSRSTSIAVMASVISSQDYGFEFSSSVMIMVISAILIVSVLLMFTVPVGNSDPAPWDKISAFIGWTYFLIWSVSFLPQLIINFRRRSVVGQSLDFVALNIVGFICLTLYNFSFYTSSTIKKEYAKRHNGATSTVVLNDVCFAVWALTASVINAVQAKIFYREPSQCVMKRVQYAIFSVFGVVFFWSLCIQLFGSSDTPVMNTLDLLYGLSYIKLGISCVKYIPQLYMNYKRKRTDGWSIENVLCDFSGGALSVIQQLMDSILTANYSGITGNPVKFALGSLSMVYDVFFLLQHFVWYRKNNLKAKAEAEEAAAGYRQSERSSLP